MSDIRFIKITPLPKPEKRPSRKSALILWMLALLGLVVCSVVVQLMGEGLSGMNVQLQLLYANLVYYLPFVVLPLIVLAARNPGLYQAYRPNPISLFNTISIVILALLGVFFVNDITVLWSIPLQKLGLNVYASGIPAASNTGELMLSILTIAVIPAICEEFLFRGAILSAFEGHGTRHAVWISSILFMLIHGTVVGMPAQLILGAILATVMFWTDSIYAGLIYHTVHNAAAIILQYLQGASAGTDTGDLYTAIGGMAGVIDLLLSIVLSAALILLTLRLLSVRGQLMGVTLEPRQRSRMRTGEWIALIIGVILCADRYLADILSMLGGFGA